MSFFILNYSASQDPQQIAALRTNGDSASVYGAQVWQNGDLPSDLWRSRQCQASAASFTISVPVMRMNLFSHSFEVYTFLGTMHSSVKPFFPNVFAAFEDCLELKLPFPRMFSFSFNVVLRQQPKRGLDWGINVSNFAVLPIFQYLSAFCDRHFGFPTVKTLCVRMCNAFWCLLRLRSENSSMRWVWHGSCRDPRSIYLIGLPLSRGQMKWIGWALEAIYIGRILVRYWESIRYAWRLDDAIA